MKNCALLLFETGLPQNMPGFLPQYPAASLSFWGNFLFLDFIIASFSTPENIDKFIFSVKNYSEIELLVTNRWKNNNIRYRIIENGIADLDIWIEEMPYDFLILTTTSYISLFKSSDLYSLIRNLPHDIVKIAINKTPIDFYIVKKEKLISIIKSYQTRITRKREKKRYLFDEILLSAFESIEEIPGKIFFHNNLMQLYKENMRLVAYSATKKYRDFIHGFRNFEFQWKEAHITESGFLRNSFVSAAAVVHGYVENSIIFPGVVIEKGTNIINSVIMNNNKIGPKAVIKNAIVLPFKKNTQKKYTIESKSMVGATASSVRNNSFPEHIYGGITVLGMNVEIPPGFKIEPGCFVEPNIPLYILKQHNKLKKGSCIASN